MGNCNRIVFHWNCILCAACSKIHVLLQIFIVNSSADVFKLTEPWNTLLKFKHEGRDVVHMDKYTFVFWHSCGAHCNKICPAL